MAEHSLIKGKKMDLLEMDEDIEGRGWKAKLWMPKGICWTEPGFFFMIRVTTPAGEVSCKDRDLGKAFETAYKKALIANL